MKKFIPFAMIILFCGFLTNTESASKAELYSNLGSSLTQNARTRNFKTGLIAPGKDGAVNKEAIMAKAASIAVPFVKNVGQFNVEVKYAADLFAGRFFLTNKELVYSLLKRVYKKGAQSDKHRRNTEPEKNIPSKGLAFREYFVNKKGAKVDFKSSGEQQAETVVSYFKGNDAGKWRSGVASYQSISLGQVYPGVEVKLKASGKNVEKIFYVSPQSNVDDIKIGVSGVAGLKIAKDGRLMFKNALGELAMRTPIAWQEIGAQRHEVKVGYRLLGDHLYGFAVMGVINGDYPLIIDPELDLLLASTYLGGSDADLGYSLALDTLGNVYLAGNTNSVDFPTTEGAYDQTTERNAHNVFADIFVSKLNSDLTKLLASTFLGGIDVDWVSSLALDSSGNIYVVGSTESADFPTTSGAYNRTYKGGDYDVYVSKLNNGLTELLASTFLGGNSAEIAYSLALDSSGNVYLAGRTNSADFPTTEGAYGQIYVGNFDNFVSKLSDNLTDLLASTYLGGSAVEQDNYLALDSSGNVYVVGSTESADFPTTSGAYDRIFNGGSEDVYISKLNNGLTELLASTFLGGNNYDRVNSLALDNAGDVYLSGYTWSADFPTTPGAYDRSHNGIWDIFISKFDNNLTTLLASTFLGGSDSDMNCFLALGSVENVYLTGITNSKDFPTTPGAYDRIFCGDDQYGHVDVFVSKLNKSLTTLSASTYLGGSSNENSTSLVIDGSGNVYLAGYTSSEDFPTTVGAYAGYSGGLDDAFVAKLGIGLSGIIVTSPNGGENWAMGTFHDITWWITSGTIAKVRIEISTDKGSIWSDVIASATNIGSYHWTIPNILSRQCLIRISDAVNASVSDVSNSVFSIFMSLDLQVERREIKAYSIVRQYGQIHFLGGNPAVPVAQYRIIRHKGTGGFILLKTVTPSELQNNQFQMQDKYLEKDTQYTYKVEAYGAAGQLVGYSAEKTI